MKNDRQDSSDIRYSKSAFTKASAAGKCQLSIYISAKEGKKDWKSAAVKMHSNADIFHAHAWCITPKNIMLILKKVHKKPDTIYGSTVLKHISGSRKEVRVSNEKLLRWALSQFSPAGPSLSCAFMLKWIHFSSSAVWQHTHTKGRIKIFWRSWMHPAAITSNHV